MKRCHHDHGCPFKSRTGWCPDHCRFSECRVVRNRKGEARAVHVELRDDRHVAKVTNLMKPPARGRHRKAS